MKRRIPDLAKYGHADLQRSLGVLSSLKVKDLLEETVPAISPKASVRDLLYRMLSEGRTAFLVWEDNPAGIVTYAEALKGYASGLNAKVTRVRDIARENDIYVAEPQGPAVPLVLWMFEKRIPLVAVYDGEALLGVITPSSSLARLAKGLMASKMALA